MRYRKVHPSFDHEPFIALQCPLKVKILKTALILKTKLFDNRHRREAAGDLLSEIEDENCSVGGRGADLVAAAVPADLEDAAGAFVRMNLQKRITMVKSY